MSITPPQFPGPGPRLPPFDVAAVVPTVGRPSLARAVRSVFAQRFEGRVQVLLGFDRPPPTADLVADLICRRPPGWGLTALDLGYSSAARHGGLYGSACGGALRTILRFAAHSRLVAYLDDDNWWADDHLATLVEAVRGRAWAYSLRWYADEATGQGLCVDAWESVGPGAGYFRDRFGGFVDPSCLLIDKLACEHVLPAWCHPLAGDPAGMSADRTVFAALRHAPHGATGRATAYYTIRATDGMHAQRLRWVAEGRGRRGPSGPPPV